MKPGISVIISSFNGSKKLSNTLSYLVAQDFMGNFEIILVDNASADDTGKFAKKWWHDHGRKDVAFYVFFEPRPGKTYAQDLGISQSQYSYLLICDDDNWLFPDYLTNAFVYMESKPEVGMIGGLGIPRSDAEFPEWFNKYSGFYAVGEQNESVGDITFKKGYVNGAGCMLRNDVWQAQIHKGIERILTCRKGKDLSAGGDNEMGYIIVAAGYQIHYTDQLKFFHFIPESRLNYDYLIKMVIGHVQAYKTTNYYQIKLGITGGDNSSLRRLVGIIKVAFIFIGLKLLPSSIRNNSLTLSLRYHHHKERIIDFWKRGSEHKMNFQIIDLNLKLINGLRN